MNIRFLILLGLREAIISIVRASTKKNSARAGLVKQTAKEGY